MDNKQNHITTSVKATAPDILFFCASVVLFLIVHLTNDQIPRLLRFAGHISLLASLVNITGDLLPYVPLIKAALFIVAIGILFTPVIYDIRSNYTTSKSHILRTTGIAIITAVFLGILAFSPENFSLGQGYAERSLAPFAQDQDWFSKRLLMPAIAYFLYFRGDWLYFVFSNLLFFLFLGLTYHWLKENTQIKVWQFVSLCTCSFAMYQYQMPGYPDVLTFTFFILVMYPGFSQRSKLGFLVLALITHEASLFIGILLACRFLDKNNRIKYFIVLILYGAIWAFIYHFGADMILASYEVKHMSGLEWILYKPGMEGLGIFIAFKAVWLLITIGMIMSWRSKQFGEAGFILACVLTGILMTVLGTDTSRLMGFAFSSALVANKSIRSNFAKTQANRLLSIIFIINLLIPSFNVGLNIGIFFSPGLYQLLFSWIH